jgi:predicted dienelactone hydrolase
MHSATERLARSTGLRTADFRDPVDGTRVPLWLMYPTQAEEQTEQFGPYSLELARDAPCVGEQLPLVAISHGRTGSPWAYRTLARELARAGFVVALPEHVGDSRSDQRLTDSAAILEVRPRQLRGAIDAAFADSALGARLAGEEVALIGHSIGGYTSLALVGGRPVPLPNQTADGKAHPVRVERDERVRKLVLLAPATPWYMADGALAEVDLPILMLTGEHDAITAAFHADIVKRGVSAKSKVDHRVIANAGHFSFQSVFPPAMTSPQFPPSQDPPGFDRAAFQRELVDDVVRFLRADSAR